MAGRKVGSLDIQFTKDWDYAKGNQLVQSVQQVITTVNLLANQATPGPPTPGVPKHVLATQSGLGADHTVAGLDVNQVLIATSGISAHFAFLEFGMIAGTDSGSFLDATNGDVIGFVDGFWSAVPASQTLGLTDPGVDALIMWNPLANAGAGGLSWALPGLGIEITTGAVSVDDFQLTHGHLLGLLADDHPQYALVADTALLDGLNVFSLVNTFQQGIVSGGDIDLAGNLEQTGGEGLEQRMTISGALPNEGAWRVHVEDGQLMFAGVNDDGTDCETWLAVQRIGDVIDTISLEASYLTYNGASVLTAAPLAGAPYLPVMLDGQTLNLQIYSASPAVGSLTLTDGTHTVGGVTQISVTGGTVGGTSPNATLTITGGGAGTVTSVAFADASTTPIYAISGSPVTSSGTLTQTLSTQSANTIFAGPTTGAAAQPSFRALVIADIPLIGITDGGTGQVTAAAAYNALSPMTTTGDIEYEASAGVAARRAIGGTGNVLTVVGGLPTWAAPAAIPTGANPIAVVGLTAVNGTATTFLRSDGAPALDQSIVPTWTGAHTFQPAGGTTLIGGNAFTGTQQLTISNTSAVGTDNARLVVSSNALNVSLFMANASSAAVITGGPTGAQATLRTLGAQPIVFGTSNNYAGQITGAQAWIINGFNGAALTVGGNVVTGQLSANITNTSTADGDNARLTVSCGAQSLQLFAYPAATSGTPTTGGPSGGQAVITTIGTIPLVFGMANIYRGQIAADGHWQIVNVGATVNSCIGAAGVQASFEFAGNGATVGTGSLGVGMTASGQAFLLARGAQSLAIGANATTAAISIASTGAVSIGAPASGSALTVTGSTATDPAMLIKGAAGKTSLFIQSADSVSIQLQVVDGGANNIACRVATTNTIGTFGVTGTNAVLALWSGGANRTFQDPNGILYKLSPAPTAVNATATLTIAQLLTLIITSTTAAAVTGTLPTGTLTDAGIFGPAGAGIAAPIDTSFDWSVIATGANSFTVAAGTGHTLVGSGVVATGTSGAFRTQKTGTNTFVTYRLAV